MHQGSVLGPLLFMMVMEALSREFRVALPWELLYANDLVVIAETEEDLIKRLNEWKDFEVNKGMRVRHTHTHTQTFYGSVEFVRDNPDEPVPEETFTHSHSSWSSIIPICFLYLLRSTASSVFNPRALG